LRTCITRDFVSNARTSADYDYSTLSERRHEPFIIHRSKLKVLSFSNETPDGSLAMAQDPRDLPAGITAVSSQDALAGSHAWLRLALALDSMELSLPQALKQRPQCNSV
jgi:hypothetical protein